MEQCVEPVLPLVTVANDAELERRAVKEDKFHRGDSLHLLDFVAQFNVLGDGAVKVDHFRVLVAPASEEDILLSFPYHFEATQKSS